LHQLPHTWLLKPLLLLLLLPLLRTLLGLWEYVDVTARAGAGTGSEFNVSCCAVIALMTRSPVSDTIVVLLPV
jgi:hypothetical protein